MIALHYKFMGVAGLTSLLIFSSTGCKQLPGSPGAQGAAIGGAGGAAAGAAIGGEHHRALGAVVGGVLGAGGGYVIGANSDRIKNHDSTGADEAMRKAQTSPATPEQALNATTADLNKDGFVTMDEVVAMKRAGLSDQQTIDRLRATGHVFELTAEQQNYLRQNGVSDTVINAMPDVNREVRDRLLTATPAESSSGVISHPATATSPRAPGY
jgi:hypothetical protein